MPLFSSMDKGRVCVLGGEEHQGCSYRVPCWKRVALGKAHNLFSYLKEDFFFSLLLFNCFCRAVMACIQLILAYLMFELISLVGLLRSYKFLTHFTIKPYLNFFVPCLKVGDLSLG